MTDPQTPITTAREVLRAALAADALDALGLRARFVGPGIAPLRPGARLVGWVFPVQLEPVEETPPVPYQGLLAAIEAVEADDVIVAACGRSDRAAVWGELISTACRARGAVGALTDGASRDVETIRGLERFEVFARGTLPADVNGRLEWGEHGAPVEIDGVSFAAGDLVVADDDGVVCVPREHVDAVVARVADKAAREGDFRRAVADGMSVTVAFDTFGVL